MFFSGVFLWLTVDTVREVGARENSHTLSAEVVRGKKIWEDNNCMGCHTILGEGAYYAPELTKVIERRGEAWIRVFIKDPEAMYPGQRRMVKYDFSDAQIDDLLAFLRWIGEIDLNGFPPEPPLKSLMQPPAIASSAAKPSRSQPQIFGALCVACHAVGGVGGSTGPALDDAYTRKDREQMIAWLRDPAAIKPGTLMPKLPLSEEQIVDLSDYLQSFGGK